jgi:hypothetical protein
VKIFVFFCRWARGLHVDVFPAQKQSEGDQSLQKGCKSLAATSESKKSKHTFPWCLLGLNKFLKLPFWRMREAVEAWS